MGKVCDSRRGHECMLGEDVCSCQALENSRLEISNCLHYLLFIRPDKEVFSVWNFGASRWEVTKIFAARVPP